MRTPDAAPALTGLSHLGLSVPDLAAAKVFWTEVMGFEELMSADGYCMVMHRPSQLAIAMSDHGGAVKGGFDELRTGLDHVAIAVRSVSELVAWQRRLAELAVPHSPLTTSEVGHHVNLRAPAGLPVELFVLSRSAAQQFGLDVGRAPVAAGYG